MNKLVLSTIIAISLFITGCASTKPYAEAVPILGMPGYKLLNTKSAYNARVGGAIQDQLTVLDSANTPVFGTTSVAAGEGLSQSMTRGLATSAVTATIAGAFQAQAAKNLRPPVVNENNTVNATGAGSVSADNAGVNATGGAGGTGTGGSSSAQGGAGGTGNGGSSSATGGAGGTGGSTGPVNTTATTGPVSATTDVTAVSGSSSESSSSARTNVDQTQTVKQQQEQEQEIVNRPNSDNTTVKNVTANVRKNSPTINIDGPNSGAVLLQNGNGNSGSANASRNNAVGND